MKMYYKYITNVFFSRKSIIEILFNISTIFLIVLIFYILNDIFLLRNDFLIFIGIFSLILAYYLTADKLNFFDKIDLSSSHFFDEKTTKDILFVEQRDIFKSCYYRVSNYLSNRVSIKRKIGKRSANEIDSTNDVKKKESK